MISCQCVTYGRVNVLEEAIACFLWQDYEDRELVILNTFPEQTLIFKHPKVTIYNLDERPSSLGVARNMCVERCNGKWITPWDDDNFFLPKQLSVFSRGFGDVDWVRIGHQFYCEKWGVKKIVPGENNLFTFTKRVWRLTRGYPSVTVGEDQEMNNLIRDEFAGRIIDPEIEDITHVYCWGNGVYHASGSAEWETAHDRLGAWTAERVRQGHIPTGTIQLNPQIKHDIKEQCEKMVARLKKSSAPK